jgi:quinol-cytochrome oxidoreductase complex cytochrome b subunit/mono/diheme cytochrome c family protein
VFARLSDWLDHRTGFRRLRDAMLLEHIPGGAKWRYVWGSALAFVFMIQLVTGVLLMTAYSASESTAWSSVYFIQYQMDFGWLIRGLHHFGSQTMVVLLGLHMLQVVIAGAHLPPREVNWWLGLGLLGMVLGLSLTGYLLSWDQKGFWATQVATNIAGNLPVLGPWLQKVVVGGPEYGHHTLTRFYALHVGVLPPLMIVLIVAHLAVFRRHGVTAPKDATGEDMFWPAQAFRDLLVCLLIVGVMLTLVLVGHGHDVTTPAAAEEQGLYEEWAHAGQRGLGANLDAPADPAKPYPARPEWYFLFLFQLLKYFEGDQEIVGTVLIPTAVGILLFLLPLLGFGKLRRFGHIFGVLVIVGLLAGVGTLTCLAIKDDVADPLTRAVITRIGTLVIPAIAGVLLLQLALLWLLPRGGVRKVVHVLGVLVMAALLVGTGSLLYAALDHREIPEQVERFVKEDMTEQEKQAPEGVATFQAERVQADKDAARAITLAREGVPETGAKYLLRRDPLTQGRLLFKQHCATCHAYTIGGVNQFPPENKNAKVEPKASDLGGYGSKEWIRGLMRHPEDPRYFGHTKVTGMTTWAEGVRKNRKEMTEAQKDEQDATFDLIADWLATHPQGKPKDKNADDLFTRGYKAFTKTPGGCVSCHGYDGAKGGGGDSAPDLTGYGSAAWVRLMVMSPASPKRHAAANEMPAFRNDQGPGAEVQLQEFRDANANVPVIALSDIDRELIIRWLVGDSRVVFGGEAITGPKH